MNLMGQTLFILKLLESIGPRSVESIALCALDGARLRPFLEAHERKDAKLSSAQVRCAS
jgi:hypothetical protein